jgi:hypothetical protein
VNGSCKVATCWRIGLLWPCQHRSWQQIASVCNKMTTLTDHPDCYANPRKVRVSKQISYSISVDYCLFSAHITAQQNVETRGCNCYCFAFVNCSHAAVTFCKLWQFEARVFSPVIHLLHVRLCVCKMSVQFNLHSISEGLLQINYRSYVIETWRL